ncbi:reverse transcriptase [Phytophthora cinnamomi]|uniref:reverse transcriptase n=1 Tax=Phytophthora cinnamomi TaxID=4785 RepID=UPI00355A2C35|nr:reverse transcriptase [Phytophthora cinnamomi]
MTAPSPPALIRSFTAAKCDTPTKRMLRTDNPYEVDEERAFGNRIVSAIKSWPSKIKMNSDLRTMLKKQQTADDALEFLKLNGGVDDLLSNPNLKNLAKYISKYNKKFPEARVTMTGTLSKKYGDDVVAAMLVAGQSLQYFLGSLNYYHRFIADFAVYATTLYSLTEVDFEELVTKPEDRGHGKWEHAVHAFEVRKI